MIIKNDKRVNKIYDGENVVQRIYKGTDKIYEYLPVGYTECKYLESTGTQYIDTNIIPTNDMGIKVKYCYTASGSAAISGIYQGNNPRTDTLFISSSNGNTSGSLFGAHRGKSYSASKIQLNTDYVSSINYFNNGKLVLGGTTAGSVGTNTVYNASIVLFARLNVNNSNISISHSKIYYTEFTEGNKITHKFIPCLETNDVPCMYDTVSKTTLYNVGTGTFNYELL